MSESLDRRAVWKYYAFAATQAAWFVTPIWTLFLLDAGLSYTQVSVLGATWWVATVLGEVPTGYVADRLGRRQSLLLGSVVHAGSVLVFGLLESFPAMLALYVVWGLGETFRSGSEGAWLYDALADATAESAFTRIKGRGTAVRLASAGITSLAGGYVATLGYYPTFALSAVVLLAGGAIALSFPKTSTEESPDVLTPGEAIPVIRRTLRQPGLGSFLLAVVAFDALGWSVTIFVQPVVRDLGLGLGLATGQVRPAMGWLYAGFAAVSALVTFQADRIESRVGARRFVSVGPVVLGLTFVSAALVPLLALPAFVLMRALVETTGVLAERFVNDRTESLGRATVLSATAMLYALGRIPARLLAGAVGDALSPLAALGVMGVLLVVAALSLRAFLAAHEPAGAAAPTD